MSNIAAFSGFVTVGKRLNDNTIVKCDPNAQEEEVKGLAEETKVILYPILRLQLQTSRHTQFLDLYPIKLKMNNTKGNKVRKVLINSPKRKTEFINAILRAQGINSQLSQYVPISNIPKSLSSKCKIFSIQFIMINKSFYT